MAAHKTILRAILKALLFPLTVIFVTFPNLLKSIAFLILKPKIRLLRPNCVFLINPSSGQMLGKRLLDFLKEMHREELCKNLFEDGVAEFLQGQIRAVPKGDRLVVVVCGGDGSVSSVIASLEKVGVDLDSCLQDEYRFPVRVF